MANGKLVRRTFKVDEEEWNRFVNKYKSASERLRELIRLDLEGKIPSKTTEIPKRES